MLVIYAATLNHWISLFNLEAVVATSGWYWIPQLNNPLYYLATLPLRALSPTAIPFALNLFSALCATLTLVLLARSVGLLPHDRTEAQLAREKNDFFLLTIRSSWFPPLLAAILCGLQLSFWQAATNGSAEMFDLLLFALVVWSLLEYRLDEREGRLFLSSAMVGAMMAEGPAMVGYFPIFIVAIIWVRGLNFFNVRFLVRMLLYGVAGTLFFLLLPILAVATGKSLSPFFLTLKFSLEPQIQLLKFGFHCVLNPTQYFENVLMPLFISLVPLLILSIRWKFGDSSRLGSTLASLTFHSIHAIFFGVCLWLAFDPPFSPREKGLGLTFYYLIALSAGYYAGYFLLIFGKKHPRAEEFPPLPVKLFNLTVLSGAWLLGILAILGLFYKNTSLIRSENSDSLRQYASLVAGSLPPNGAIVLSDYPAQLFFTEAALAESGRTKDYLLIDAPSLIYPKYHAFLHEKSQGKWPLLVSPEQTNTVGWFGLIHMLTILNTSNRLYYLHPNQGILFEEFYQESHGLVTELKTLPNATLLPPAPDKNLIEENQKFWNEAQTGPLASVEDELATPDPAVPESSADKLLSRLHASHEGDATAIFIGTFCAKALDSWGVNLQRGNDITNAAACFQMALRFKPDNIPARINLKVNGDLLAGRQPDLDFSKTSDTGKFTSLADVIKVDGPFDDPAFCFIYGNALVKDNGFYRQAAAPLERVLQFAPLYTPARILLMQVYLLNHLPDRALDVANAPLPGRPEDQQLDDSTSTELHVLTATAYFQKNDIAHGTALLENEIPRNPTNDLLLVSVIKVYIDHGMYSNAQVVVNNRLSFSPDDPNWLYTKGYIDTQMKKYSEAIDIFNHVIAAQKDNPRALFQRGNAYKDSGNLDAARTDFEQVQQLQTNSYEAAFALGDMAWNRHDTNEAIRNFEIYLSNAPTNAPQIQTVTGRLGELKQTAGSK